MAAKKYLFLFESFVIKDGSEICFWGGQVAGKCHSSRIVSNLVPHCTRKEWYSCASAQFISAGYIFSGKIWLAPRLLSWQHFLPWLDSISQAKGRDVFHWNLTMSGSFTVERAFMSLLVFCANDNIIVGLTMCLSCTQCWWIIEGKHWWLDTPPFWKWKRIGSRSPFTLYLSHLGQLHY